MSHGLNSSDNLSTKQGNMAALLSRYRPFIRAVRHAVAVGTGTRSSRILQSVNGTVLGAVLNTTGIQTLQSISLIKDLNCSHHKGRIWYRGAHGNRRIYFSNACGYRV